MIIGEQPFAPRVGFSQSNCVREILIRRKTGEPWLSRSLIRNCFQIGQTKKFSGRVLSKNVLRDPDDENRACQIRQPLEPRYWEPSHNIFPLQPSFEYLRVSFPIDIESR